MINVKTAPDGNGIVTEFICERDHCSVAERAVIEAALAWYEWVDQLQKLSDAEVRLVNAASLARHRRIALAARKERT